MNIKKGDRLLVAVQDRRIAGRVVARTIAKRQVVIHYEAEDGAKHTTRLRHIVAVNDREPPRDWQFT